MSSEGIIRDARVLKEHFIPSRILHRDGQLKAVRDNLEPVLRRKEPRDTLLVGTTGTGKTCMSRYLLEELSKQSSRVKTSYVNCFENSSRFRVLYEIVREIGGILSVHEKGTPTDEVLEKMRKLVEGTYCIVILDEVDKLKEPDVLYSLARTPEIGLILISNRDTALYRVDSRIRSSLACLETIEFPAYGMEELVDILKDRADWGLMPDSITRKQMEMIAMLAEGDARLAIDTLRVVAERSEERGKDFIDEMLIEDAVNTAKDEIDSKTLEVLNDEEILLYNILREERVMKAGELHKRYREEKDRPAVPRAVRNYLNRLERLRLIEAEGNGRWRVYKVKM